MRGERIRVHSRGISHVRFGLLAVFAEREQVSELRIGELVDGGAGGGHREVAPHVFARAEVQLGHCAARRPEALLRPLARDARRDHVAVRLGPVRRRLKRDLRRPVRLLAVQHADLALSVQWDAHRDLLSSRNGSKSEFAQLVISTGENRTVQYTAEQNRTVLYYRINGVSNSASRISINK